MKKLLLTLATCAASIAVSQAAVTFTIGQVGTTANLNNWPGAETPNLAMDGAAGTKYLNFSRPVPNGPNEYNSGYIFTPTSGAATIIGINFATANDAVERDPTSYILYGSNSVSASTTTGTVFDVTANFTQISAGSLALPATRLTAGGNVTFANPTAYQTFLLVFPTVFNPATANSMQIGEARLQTSGGDLDNVGVVGGGRLVVPEPATGLLGALAALGLTVRRRRA